MTKPNIHGFWHEGPLSPFALLTIRSFLRHEGRFTLWTYDKMLTAECEIRDASEVMSESSVFLYEDGPGKGSVSGYSDIFRSKLLFDQGGLWVDMDVTLLRPLPKLPEIVLRGHWRHPIVGNIMRFPAGHVAMKTAYELTVEHVDQNNRYWEKPIQILSFACVQAGVTGSIQQISHRDEFIDVLPFARLNVEFPKSWWAMHWCNEMWRRGGRNQSISKDSALSRLFDDYDIEPMLSASDAIKVSGKTPG